MSDKSGNLNLVSNLEKCSGFDATRSLEKDAEISFLRQQLETLKQKLLGEGDLTNLYRQKLKNTEKELQSLNDELHTAHMLKKLKLDLAKQLAKSILKSNKSATASLAELLSAIYGSQVLPEELEDLPQRTR